MGAVESTDATTNTTTGATGPQRRRYCGNFLGFNEESEAENGKPTPQSNTRSISRAAATPSSGPEEATVVSGGSASSSPALAGRTLSPFGSPGSPLQVSIPGSPQTLALDGGKALTAGELQLAEIERQKNAKRELRKSQTLNKKLIKQIKKETLAEEKQRLREERAFAEAEAERFALAAAAEFELKSWSVAIDKYRAERTLRQMIVLPTTFDAAIKFLSSKENKRKLIILSVLSLERCELDLAPSAAVGSDSKLSLEEKKKSDAEAVAKAQAAKLAAEKAAAMMTPRSGKASVAEADAKMASAVKNYHNNQSVVVDIPLKDAYNFRFAIRNPSNGIESEGEAWAVVYKTVKSDTLQITYEPPEVRPCVVGEVIGGWTKK